MLQAWSFSATLIPSHPALARSRVCRFVPTVIHQRSRLGNAARRLNSTPGRRFSDFLEQEEGGAEGVEKSAEEKAQELIDRTASVLQRAQAALEDVRRREPSDSRHRRSGADVVSGPTLKTTSSNSTPTTSAAAQSGGGSGIGGVSTTARPSITSLPLAWASDSDTEEEEGDDDEGANSISFLKRSTSSPSSGLGGGGSGSSSSGSGSSNAAPGGLDSWFGDKIDTGSMELRPSAVTPTRAGALPSTTGPAVAVLDRPDMPSSFEFAAPEAPPESGGASIFPEGLAMRFQSETEKKINIPSAAKPAGAASDDKVTWERTTGEEFGDNGYWYRWTEIQGKDESGTVQWSERWWEVSDWKGMKELGAEKWGSNDRGDAWRESWRESIGFDAATGQPMVERTAHKWARAGTTREWEEKWGESYLSGGKAEKFADKWAREGTDTWHEKWGENYDGQGGCVKYTDRWAERPPGGYDAGGSLDKWGEKWEEIFKDGRGTKRGETWSESAMGDRYQRWWGENHEGGGVVQKFGHSNTGEHWDVTEHMDTYYNPIPHFGYDLALAHSPILREVPALPRDNKLDGNGGKGGGKKGGGGGDLGGIFG